MISLRCQIIPLLACLTAAGVLGKPGDCTSDANCAASTCLDGGPPTCVKPLAIGQCICKDGATAEAVVDVVPDLIGGGLFQVHTISTTPFTSRPTATGTISIGTGADSVMDSMTMVTGPSDGVNWNTTSAKSTSMTLLASAADCVTSAQVATQNLNTNNLDDTIAKLAKNQIEKALTASYFLQDALHNPILDNSIHKFVSAMTRASMDATSAVTAPSTSLILKMTNDLLEARTVLDALFELVNLRFNSTTNTTSPNSVDADSACPMAKRYTRYRRTLNARTDPLVKGCFILNFQGAINPPINDNEAPVSITCNSSKGPHQYAKSSVLAALEQGARYSLGGQVATPAGYPHAFLDLPAVSPVTISSSCAGKTVLEFPILPPDGSQLVNVGKKNKVLRPGPDRVLFYIDLQTRETGYCGMVTHHQEDKILDPVSGKSYLPFVDCAI